MALVLNTIFALKINNALILCQVQSTSTWSKTIRNYGVQDEKYQNMFKVNKIEHNVYINGDHFKDKIN